MLYVCTVGQYIIYLAFSRSWETDWKCWW